MEDPGKIASDVQYANCIDCQSQFPVTAPKPLYFNHPGVSMIVITHEQASVCENCGAVYVFIVKPEGCTLQIQLNKLPSENRIVKPLLILPGSPRMQ